ncbi:MBL fold metallo-hydrolase [Cupriavidus gilardii]|nr:MBL fold metallo-hydrolase [Cupriavidus gilardii]
MTPSRLALPRRVLPLALAAALSCAALAGTPAHAQGVPAQQQNQVPGYYRMMLGEFEITALYDGYIDVDPKLLRNTSAREVQSLLARMFVESTPGVQTAVNGFLIHTGKNLVLIDTGAGACFGPALGKIVDNVRAAGYDPMQIDTVLLTHLHGDHACGLAVDGKPAFPTATVHASQMDADYWLSQDVADKAPAEAQPYFKMARDAVAPYQAGGRFRTFKAGDEVVPGIAAVAAYGHTPGHTGYLLRSEKKGKAQSLLVWGDIVHSHAVQFRRPDVAIEFDVDSRAAVRTRKRLFNDAARNKLWVAGMHLPFPGIGHVRADGNGYTWVPVEFGPIRTDR